MSEAAHQLKSHEITWTRFKLRNHNWDEVRKDLNSVQWSHSTTSTLCPFQEETKLYQNFQSFEWSEFPLLNHVLGRGDYRSNTELGRKAPYVHPYLPSTSSAHNTSNTLSLFPESQNLGFIKPNHTTKRSKSISMDFWKGRQNTAF